MKKLKAKGITYEDIISSCCLQLMAFLSKVEYAPSLAIVEYAPITKVSLELLCDDALNGVSLKEKQCAFETLLKIRQNLNGGKENEKI